MQTYPAQMYPPASLLIKSSCTEPYYQFDMWKNAEVPRSDVTPTLINLVVQHPSMPGQFVWHVEQCRCTQVRCTPIPKLNLLVQSTTTPCVFHMWQNADMTRSDIPPPSIEPSGTEPYYTRSVWHVAECRHAQVICIPH